MSEEYLRQMRKLELQEKDLTSQYTDLERIQPEDYKSVVNSNVTYAPHKGETWKNFALRIEIFADINAETSRKTHIDGPRKAWYTHRNPAGCFICNDMNLIHLMKRVIGEMAHNYPDNKF